MKKLSVMLLLFLFAGMQSLIAQDAVEEGGTLTAKVTPSVYGQGRIYFAGEEARKGDGIQTTGDAEARAKFEADYKGIGGVKVEIEGEINKAKSDAFTLGFGDNAYAYIHALEVFGIDKKMFDVYLQSGRFEVEFDNAKEAGQDTWLADVDGITRDEKVNMQLDLKILDMLTIRYGLGFKNFDSTNDSKVDKKDVKKGGVLDMGWALLFSKTFGDHKIDASLAYVADLMNTKKTVITSPAYFDQLGFSIAYTGTFGTIKLMPFFNMRIKGLINKPEYSSYVDPMIGWSAGVKFQLRDKGNSYDLFGAGLDLGGSTRGSENYKNSAGTTVEAPAIENAAFQGLGIKVWSDGLRSVMGKNYLHIWAKARLGLNTPNKFTVGGITYTTTRKGYLAYWGIGLEQYLVNVANASVKLKAEFGMENIAPYLVEASAGGAKATELYISGISSGKVTAAHTPFKIFFDLGLDASFTSVFTAKTK